MDRREDGAAFPIVGEDRVSQWVDEMGAAYTAGAHVLWVITAEPRPTLRASFGDSDDLRLGYVHRAAELLRDRPERASVVSRIHRFFDDARWGTRARCFWNRCARTSWPTSSRRGRRPAESMCA
jgi:hypothetical protein